MLGEREFMEPRRLATSIPDYEVRQDNDGKYISYRISMRYDRTSWSMHHRYNNFTGLNAELTAKLPHLKLPNLPRKNFGNTMSDNIFIEDRRTSLEAYIRQLLNFRDICKFEPFLKFVGWTRSNLSSQSQILDTPKQMKLIKDHSSQLQKQLDNANVQISSYASKVDMLNMKIERLQLSGVGDVETLFADVASASTSEDGTEVAEPSTPAVVEDVAATGPPASVPFSSRVKFASTRHFPMIVQVMNDPDASVGDIRTVPATGTKTSEDSSAATNKYYLHAVAVWNGIANDIVKLLIPQERQVIYRASAGAFIADQVKSTLNSSQLFETGLQALRCYLPDDAISLFLVIWRNIETGWHLRLNEQLCKCGTVLATSASTVSGSTSGSMVSGTSPTPSNVASVVPTTTSTGFFPHNIANSSFDSVIVTTTAPGQTPPALAHVQQQVHTVQCTVDSTLAVNIRSNVRKDVAFFAFLEEFDRLVDREHLFKRSIILIRAWWMYETTAYLEVPVNMCLSDAAVCTMICSVFYQYYSLIHHPFQALCLFLAEYSSVDFSKHACTIRGCVPVSELCTSTVEKKESGMMQDRRMHLLQMFQNEVDSLIQQCQEVAVATEHDPGLYITPTRTFGEAPGPSRSTDAIVWFTVVNPLYTMPVNMIPSTLTQSQSSRITKVMLIGAKTLNHAIVSVVSEKAKLRSPTAATPKPPVQLFFSNVVSRFGGESSAASTSGSVGCWRPDCFESVMPRESAVPSLLSLNSSLQKLSYMLLNPDGSSSKERDSQSQFGMSTRSIFTLGASNSNANGTVEYGQDYSVSMFSRTLSSFSDRSSSLADSVYRASSASGLSIASAYSGSTTVSSSAKVIPVPTSSCSSFDFELDSSNDALAIPVDKMWKRLFYTKLLMDGSISESGLCSLACNILQEKGALPVGEIGKMLQETSLLSSLPGYLKEKYGGLKKFLEKFDEFNISDDHPFNPSVYLKNQHRPREDSASAGPRSSTGSATSTPNKGNKTNSNPNSEKKQSKSTLASFSASSSKKKGPLASTSRAGKSNVNYYQYGDGAEYYGGMNLDPTGANRRYPYYGENVGLDGYGAIHNNGGHYPQPTSGPVSTDKSGHLMKSAPGLHATKQKNNSIGRYMSPYEHSNISYESYDSSMMGVSASDDVTRGVSSSFDSILTDAGVRSAPENGKNTLQKASMLIPDVGPSPPFDPLLLAISPAHSSLTNSRHSFAGSSPSHSKAHPLLNGNLPFSSPPLHQSLLFKNDTNTNNKETSEGYVSPNPNPNIAQFDDFDIFGPNPLAQAYFPGK